MNTRLCQNCGRRTWHKRHIGAGTVIAALLTGGLSLWLIPFYPARCAVCGHAPGVSARGFGLLVLGLVLPALLISVYATLSSGRKSGSRMHAATRQRIAASRAAPLATKSLPKLSYDAHMARLHRQSASEAAMTPEAKVWMRCAKDQIDRGWVLPPGFRSEPLETQIDVRLNATGELLRSWIIRGSGNPWFDRSVERAIHKAGALCPPPPHGGDWQFAFRPADAS